MSRATKPWFYLRADERVLLRQAPPPGFFVLRLLAYAWLPTVAAVAGLVALAFFPDAPLRPAWLVLGWAAALALAALVAWRRWATTEYVLTDQRVYARTGRLVTRVHLTTHDKVTDVLYRQGPLERFLGVSSLTFSTGGGDVHVQGVPDALVVKEAAERARDAFLQRLLERGGLPARAPPAAARPAPEPPGGEPAVPGTPPAEPAAPAAPLPGWTGPRPDYVKAGDAPAWQAKPSTASMAEALKVPGAFLVALLIGQMANPLAAFLLLPLGLFFTLLFVSVRLLQIHRTEYVATDRRVYARTGIVGTTVHQLTYDKITDITYKQDLLGRLFGYGTVTLATAGGAAGGIALQNLARPLQAKESIEALRARYLQEADR